MQPNERPMSTAECAKLIGKHPTSLRKSLDKWKIPYHRIGGRLAFYESEVRGWINSTGNNMPDDKILVDTVSSGK